MTQKHVLLFVAVAMLIAFPAAGQAQLSLTGFSFSPTTINVASSPVDVTVSFTASSTSASVAYFEMAFADTSGVFLQRGSKSLAPAPVVSDSVVVSFPAFSPAGTWTVLAVFLADTAGNTKLLTTADLIAGGFSTNLTVTSAVDGIMPEITAFSFSPASINTNLGPQDVVVTFEATDDLAGVSSVYAGFTSPSGQTTNGTRVSAPDDFMAGSPVSDSLTISFPKLSEPGTWKVSFINIVDGAGNNLFLDTAAAAARGFSTDLTVTSALDTTPPDITSFSFGPTTIDTSLASQNVVVNFTATDNLAGVTSVYAGFVSPSAQTINDARVNAPVDFIAGTSVSDTLTIPFPKQSEPGPWKVSFINIVDALGNTLFLDTTQASMRGFPTDLTVVSTPDTQPPTLTNFDFDSSLPDPHTIGAGGGPVEVSFTATDDLSGVNQFEVLFLSPSGTQAQSAAGSFAAATSHSGSVFVDFPTDPEPGIWTVSLVFLSDAAGNSSLLFTGDLGGFPTQLTVLPPGADGTPPTIFPTVSPAPNGGDWNNSVPVMVSWVVNDPESGISSTTDCGPTTLSSATTGTTLTCSASSEGGTNSVSVTVKIDLAAPVTSDVDATPNPIPLGGDLAITANITDDGGSNIAAAEFNVDGGPFDDLAAADGTFDSSTELIDVTFPGSHPLLIQPGVHTICVRGTDGADNIGATECVVVAVHGVNSTTGGGGTNSPAGADLADMLGFGPVIYGFNAKYGPGDTVPTGNFEFHYKAGDITFKESGFDFLVVVPNSNRAQIQGTGVLNENSICKFLIDAWDGSFLPDNVDAFGLRIFDCDGVPGDRYNLPATPVTKGNIQVRQ